MATSTRASPPPQEPQILAVPIKLDAFVLNAAVCGGSSKQPQDDENADKAKIAPFKQPNYTFLRFERTKVQNDTLEFTDLHRTGPAAFNSRFTDLRTGEPHTNRQGVYVHWIMPRAYRTGSAMSQDPVVEQKSRAHQGFSPRTPKNRVPSADPGRSTKTNTGDPLPPTEVDQGDVAAPDFRPAPSRWMVIRKVETCDPPNALPDLDAWVVESNRCTLIDDIKTTPDVDIQVDYAPFVAASQGAQDLNDAAIKTQAEVFIGYKEGASTWQESEVPSPLSDPPQPQPPIDRVDLNLVNSSNQIFTDYQPHNGNVFSIIDPLQYENSQDGQTMVVNTALVSYYVLGWHATAAQDPFGNLNPSEKPLITRGDRLAALNIILDQTDPTTQGGINDWLVSPTPTQILCHGAMYNVQWNASAKPTNVPADTFFDKIKADVPVSVGTTPMDALLTYIKSHSSPSSANDANDIKEVEKILMLLQNLLHARDDGVGAQVEAEDMVYNWNYAISNGGLHYFLGGSNDAGKDQPGKPTQPSDACITDLSAVNATQRYLDGLDRQLQLLRWEMFAYWWEYLSSPTQPDSIKTEGKVNQMTAALLSLLEKRQDVTQRVGDQVEKLPKDLARQGVLPPFYEARDPTMLVAGVESGWPWDFLLSLRGRLDTQVVVPSSSVPSLDPHSSDFCTEIISKLPQSLIQTANRLAVEFFALNPANTQSPSSGNGYLIPLYHDLDKGHLLPNGTPPWRDRWEDSQAWFPLFLEWVAEYTHVPFAQTGNVPPCWSLGQQGAWPSQSEKLRYGINSNVELADYEIQDKRTVSGRVLLLPQANLNLQTIVEQILANLPDGILSPDQIQELRNYIHELAFLSSPLSGFINHLLTRVQGNHIKPTLRVNSPAPNDSRSVVPFQAAVAVGSDVGFQETQLSMMGVETDLTPYGTLVGTLDSQNCPFKPVTHGQFRFTTLNIIDKFGQAIPIIDQTPRPVVEGPPPLYPCISEYYTPQALDTNVKKANTVVSDAENLCQYIQIPPSINQPAKLNATFVAYVDQNKSTGSPAGWQPLQEWDPDFVWGWVVPNYADSGIQLFLPDGTFFREIRLGGPNGATSSGSFLPFSAPEMSSDPNFKQLELFVQELMDKDYLHSFTAMLEMALGTIAPPPTAYSEFMSSIVGRPLALVKAAYSLELASRPYANQSTLGDAPIPPNQYLEDYSFGIQLGDASRVYDGLIAYLSPRGSDPLNPPSAGDALDLKTFYTHFVPSTSEVPIPNLTKIGPDNYPTVQPFWLDPMANDITISADPEVIYSQKWNSQLTPLGAVIDPFVPFHAYTGVLPTCATQLPAWTWQTALKRMTAFFHMGPLLTTTDVPGFSSQHRLTQDYNLTDGSQILPDSQVGVPSTQAGQWAWLQPYSVDDASEQPGKEDADAASLITETAFMALTIAAVDAKPRLEASPYTALEGYMQLRQPIEQVVVPQPNAEA